MIASLGVDRDAAEARAAELRQVVANVEGLHEPDVGGECPACRTQSPCLTLQLVHGLITLEAPCPPRRVARVRPPPGAVSPPRRTARPMPLAPGGTPGPPPPIPSLKELMA